MLPSKKSIRARLRVLKLQLKELGCIERDLAAGEMHRALAEYYSVKITNLHREINELETELTNRLHRPGPEKRDTSVPDYGPDD